MHVKATCRDSGRRRRRRRRRRIWNTGADAAANLALNTGQTKPLSEEAIAILKEWAFEGSQVHVDGRFVDGVAACGVTFTIWHIQNESWRQHLTG